MSKQLNNKQLKWETQLWRPRRGCAVNFWSRF